MIKKEDLIEIGKFQKTHALKGELNAILDIDASLIDDNFPLIIETDGILVPYYVENIRKKGNTSFLIKLNGIENEKDAKVMVNEKIFALKDKIKALFEEEGEEVLAKDDLIDYVVISEPQNLEIGKIIEIDDTTTNIILKIENNEENIIMIPLVEEWILEINNETKKIYMNLPEGLIELNEPTK